MPRAKILLVTGTDTGVGKTRVTVALTALLRTRVDAIACKLIETGCSEQNGILQAEDAIALATASNKRDQWQSLVAQRFRTPAAPLTASTIEGEPIFSEQLFAWIQQLQSEHEYLLVEGAGGLLVPITPELSFAELASRLGCPVVVVARHQLGTINHTRLTIEALASRKLTCPAVITNTTTQTPDTVAHTAELARLLKAPCFGPLSWAPQKTTMELVAELQESGVTFEKALTFFEANNSH